MSVTVFLVMWVKAALVNVPERALPTRVARDAMEASDMVQITYCWNQPFTGDTTDTANTLLKFTGVTLNQIILEHMNTRLSMTGSVRTLICGSSNQIVYL